MLWSCSNCPPRQWWCRARSHAQLQRAACRSRSSLFTRLLIFTLYTMLLWETTDWLRDWIFKSFSICCVSEKCIYNESRCKWGSSRHVATTPRPGVEKMSCSTAALLTLWHTALLRPHLETMNPGLRATVITRWLLYKFACNVGGWLGGNDHLKKHDD